MAAMPAIPAIPKTKTAMMTDTVNLRLGFESDSSDGNLSDRVDSVSASTVRAIGAGDASKTTGYSTGA